MHFNSNIKLLRKRKKLSQADIAEQLKISRSNVRNYEVGTAQPGIEFLVAFSDFFNVSIDTLVRYDLEKLSESQLSEFDRGFDIFVSSKKLRVLAKTVDSHENENIEFVPEQAEAGYTSGYADPEFISQLPVFHLPFLSRERKYRAFELHGDSMLPIPSGSYVIGEFTENWFGLKTGEAYIIVTTDAGIVFKIVENLVDAQRKLRLHSLNSIYDSYEISISQVIEAWHFVNYVSNELPSENSEEDWKQTIRHIKEDMEELKAGLKLKQ